MAMINFEVDGGAQEVAILKSTVSVHKGGMKSLNIPCDLNCILVSKYINMEDQTIFSSQKLL